MKKATAFALTALVILSTPTLVFSDSAQFADHQCKVRTARVPVDIAILLDTSNSMDGLIHQAKSQLWTIVQQFALASKDGHSSKLRVALFEYGNNGLPASEGYLRQVVPLSDDLDVLSEALFSLTTDGGDEYCGQVIDQAITRLDWSRDARSYQAIFIAGNEPFKQGSVDYHHSCRRALDRNIIINTIHCGDYQAGVQGEWQHGAQIAKGEFLNINQDRAIVHIPCPQDDDIIFYNEKLNKTYLWFGSKDKRGYYLENQAAQDSNLQSLSSSAAVNRFVTKAGKAYSNNSRDLVDALEDDEMILDNVAEEDLPDVMQDMTKEERKAYLKEMADERLKLKKKISELAAEREIFLAAERKKLSQGTDEGTLGDAVVIAVRKQLVDAGFVVDSAGN